MRRPTLAAVCLGLALASTSCRRQDLTLRPDRVEADAADEVPPVTIELDPAPLARLPHARTPSPPLAPALEAKVAELRGTGEVGGARIGFGGARTSPFFRVGLAVLPRATRADLDALLADDDPSLRSLALWGFALRGLGEPVVRHLGDPTPIARHFPGGCLSGTATVGRIAQDFLADPEWPGRLRGAPSAAAPVLGASAYDELAIRLLASDDFEASSGFYRHLRDVAPVAVTWQELRARAPSVPAWKLVKAFARLHAGSSTPWLRSVLDDRSLPADARLAATSALARSAGDEIDAVLAAHSRMLDSAGPGLARRLRDAARAKRRADALLERFRRGPSSDLERLAPRTAAAILPPHPSVLDVLIGDGRTHGAREPEVQRARGIALRALADMLPGYEACWDAHRGTAYALARALVDKDSRARLSETMSPAELASFETIVTAAVDRLDADVRCR